MKELNLYGLRILGIDTFWREELVSKNDLLL